MKGRLFLSMRFFIAGLIFFLPVVTEAAVIISEVAWMGSSASANHEWIELYNDGTTVDVTGWTLTDGMNLTIPLTGTITGQSYVVLERTSDVSAAGTAFLIYTGSLVNTGATLQVKRSDGGLEDQVAGGADWQNIGGDNITKETAQYTTAGWVTGVATPGAINSGTPQDNGDDEDEETANETDDNTPEPAPKVKLNSGEAVQLILPDTILKLSVLAQKLGYVNQAIDFKVKPSGVGETFIDSLQYEWNFGDGMTALAKEPTHSYKYPGTYIATVYGGYKRQEQVARHEITILPVTISLTISSKGDLQFNNDSAYEIDISGYQVDGGKKFIFPARSIVLPNQTITLTPHQVGDPRRAEVKDIAGIRVLTARVQKIDTPTQATATDKITITKPIAVNTKEKIKSWHPPLTPKDPEDTLKSLLEGYLSPTTVQAATPIVTTSSTKTTPVPEVAWPYLALIGVIILGLFGTASKLTRNQDG